MHSTFQNYFYFSCARAAKLKCVTFVVRLSYCCKISDRHFLVRRVGKCYHMSEKHISRHFMIFGHYFWLEPSKFYYNYNVSIGLELKWSGSGSGALVIVSDLEDPCSNPSNGNHFDLSFTALSALHSFIIIGC